MLPTGSSELRNRMYMSNVEKLLSVFEELKGAILKCDERRLDELISDDYQGFSLNGTIETKEIILQTFKPGCIRISKYIAEDVKCEISDSYGIITGKGEIEGSYDGIEFQHQVLFTDIFKYINKNWQYYKSQTTEIKSA